MILDFKDTILNFIESYIRENVHTALPGIVVDNSRLNSSQTVDVTIALSRLDSTGDVLDYKGGVIYDVPVIFPAAGGGSLTFPIKKGDPVLLFFGMRNIDSWMLSRGNKEVIPEDSRHYSIVDAIAFPCFYTQKNNISPNAENVELKFNNCTIKIQPDDTIFIQNSNASIEIQSSGNINILGQTININGVQIDSSGNLSTPGSIQGNQVTDTATNNTLSTHTHPSNGTPPTPGT